MAITTTINNTYDLRRAFAKYGYGSDYFTEEACEFLLDFYDDTDLDAFGICWTWSEYDEEELCENYSYKYPVEDFKEEYAIEGELSVSDKERYIEELIKLIEMRATCVSLDNGNILIAE